MQHHNSRQTAVSPTRGQCTAASPQPTAISPAQGGVVQQNQVPGGGASAATPFVDLPLPLSSSSFGFLPEATAVLLTLRVVYRVSVFRGLVDISYFHWSKSVVRVCLVCAFVVCVCVCIYLVISPMIPT